jgi:hypothetical protein
MEINGQRAHVSNTIMKKWIKQNPTPPRGPAPATTGITEPTTTRMTKPRTTRITKPTTTRITKPPIIRITGHEGDIRSTGMAVLATS